MKESVQAIEITVRQVAYDVQQAANALKQLLKVWNKQREPWFALKVYKLLEHKSPEQITEQAEDKWN